MKLGNEAIPLKYKNEELPQFGLESYLDLVYLPETDSVSLNFFSILFSKEEWINLKDSITSVTGSNPKIDISTKESVINLNPVGDILSKFSGMYLKQCFLRWMNQLRKQIVVHEQYLSAIEDRFCYLKLWNQ